MFLDNTFRSNFDVGHTSPGLLAFGAEGGELDYYLIYGPDPKRVIQRYTRDDRAHAAAAPMGARLSPVPLQLLSRSRASGSSPATSASAGFRPT